MMNKKLLFFFSVISLTIISVAFESCYYDDESYLYGLSCSDSTYTYNGKIKSIVDQNCAVSGCHVSPQPASNISLASYADVKANAEGGEFFCTINWNSGCSKMPKNGGQLDKCSIKALEEWKNLGYPEN